jgi:hypothetical protein
VELGKAIIIFNTPHPSKLLHLHDKASRSVFLLLTQEIKRDVIYRCRNLPPSAQQGSSHNSAAHLDSTIRKICSYLQYNGFVK